MDRDEKPNFREELELISNSAEVEEDSDTNEKSEEKNSLEFSQIAFRGEEEIAASLAELGGQLELLAQLRLLADETDEVQRIRLESRAEQLETIHGDEVRNWIVFNFCEALGKLDALLWVNGHQWDNHVSERDLKTTDRAFSMLFRVLPRNREPLVMRRSLDDVLASVDEHVDKLWWNRHQIWVQNISIGKVKAGCDSATLEGAKSSAGRMTKKYGEEFLRCDGFEEGVLIGHISALQWATGSQWDMICT